MLNYESEVNEIFLKALQQMYSIEDETVVFHYFLLRFYIEHFDIKIDKWNKNRLLVEFLLKELNIPSTKEGISYKGVSLQKRFGLENSLENILIDWEFRSSLAPVITSKGVNLRFEAYIKTEKERLFKQGRNKAKPYKDTRCYAFYFKWNALLLLNKRFMAKVDMPNKLNGIDYPEFHEDFLRTIEERCLSEIHSFELNTSHIHTITEHDLEQYMIKHLELIEEGLRYVKNQHVVKDGRIDILAKDTKGLYVIVELKVQEDKELLWQSLYYPSQIKKEYGVEKVRMITLAPDYPAHILAPLKNIEEVEPLCFTPIIELGKIKELTVSRV